MWINLAPLGCIFLGERLQSLGCRSFPVAASEPGGKSIPLEEFMRVVLAPGLATRESHARLCPLGGPALCHHGAQHKKVWPALTIGPDNTFHVDTRAISPE